MGFVFHTPVPDNDINDGPKKRKPSGMPESVSETAAIAGHA